MDESKMTNYLLLGIVTLMLFTYFFTVSVNLGASVDMDSQIIAAING